VRFAALLIGALTFLPSVFAQEPQWWTDQKRTCRLPSNLAYNDWVQSGSPCNSGSAGVGGTALPAAPSGATLQQQMALSAAQAAMPYLQQAVHNFLYGSPTNQPVVDPAQQQRFLAAEQLNNSGIYLFKQKNYAGASNEFQKALEQTPNDANIINNLALAKQQLNIQQLNGKAAAQTSGALGQLLGTAPANTGNLNFDQLTHSSITNPNASTLNLVNLGSDAGTVDLRNATKTSVDPQSLKNQIDGVLTNRSPASEPPGPQVVPPQAQDIELLFQPPQSTSSQFPGPQRPADSPKLVNPMDAQEQTKAQVEAIFAQPGGLDDILEKQALGVNAKPAADPPLKDALNDPPSDQKRARGLFGTTVAKPDSTDLTLAGPAATPGTNTNAGAQVKTAADVAGKNGDLRKIYDEGGAKSTGALAFPKAPSRDVPPAIPPDVPKQYLGDSQVVKFQAQWQAARADWAKADAKKQAIQEARKKPDANKGALDVAETNADTELSAATSKLSSATLNIEGRVDTLKKSFHEDPVGQPKN
jgi:hypothetical protein